MKKIKTIVLFIVLCMTFFSFSQMDEKPGHSSVDRNLPQQSLTVTSMLLDANSISAWYRTNGSFNRNVMTGNAGFEWPKGTGKTARFASGVWMGCVSGLDTLTAIAEFSYDYLPGYVDNAGLPQGDDNPLYRIYSITRGDSTSADYLAWPVSQGAYTTPAGKPYFLGNQTMFYSITDAYPHSSGFTSPQSLKAVILQTNWSYTIGGLNDVEFSEYRIINRSSTPWVNTYFAFWTDDDIGDAVDDVIGCDTVRNLGFTYNADDNDPIYGTAPPAVGSLVLRSPITATGNTNDTAIYYEPPGSTNLVRKAGYRFTGMNVFNSYNNGAPEPSDPNTNKQVYNVLEGYWKFGNSWTNPATGEITKKTYSGDPESGTGWIMTGGGDRRYLQGVGPITVNPGDTQSVMIAQLITRGSSNLNSVTQLKNLSDQVQTIYNSNFQSVLAVHNLSSVVPDKFSLSQNYPNPFNPNTKINYELRITNYVSLKIFDVLGNEVKTLVNEKQTAGSYQVDFDGSGLSSGIYFYTLKTDGFSDTKRMILLK